MCTDTKCNLLIIQELSFSFFSLSLSYPSLYLFIYLEREMLGKLGSIALVGRPVKENEKL